MTTSSNRKKDQFLLVRFRGTLLSQPPVVEATRVI